MEGNNGNGGSLVLLFAQNLVHQLNVEVPKAMHLSTHAVFVKLKVKSEASAGSVSPASGIMPICIRPIKTRYSSPTRKARCPIWPVMIEYLHPYQHIQQPLNF